MNKEEREQLEKGYADALEMARPFLEKLDECAEKRMELAYQNGKFKGIIWSMLTSLKDHGINPVDVFSEELRIAVAEDTGFRYI